MVEISRRESEVLAAVGEHLSNAQIAHRLHISVRTVESHVSSLLRKLGADDRRALAEAAVRRARARPFRRHPRQPDHVRRPYAGRGPRPRTADPGPPGDPVRPGRHRQDPAGHGRGRGRGARVPGRRGLRRPGAGARRLPRAHRRRRAGRHRPAAAVTGGRRREAARRRAVVARARQLRASRGRGRPVRGAGAVRVSGRDDPRHEPAAAGPDRRARRPRTAAAPGLRRRAAVPGPGTGRGARLRRRPGDGDPDLRPARRHAAGHRAGRRPHGVARHRGAARGAGRATAPAGRRSAGRRAAPLAARGHRVEPRPARRGRAGVVPPAVRVRGRLRPGRRGRDDTGRHARRDGRPRRAAGRPEPGRARRVRCRPVAAAGPGAGVRPGAVGGGG